MTDKTLQRRIIEAIRAGKTTRREIGHWLFRDTIHPNSYYVAVGAEIGSALQRMRKAGDIGHVPRAGWIEQINCFHGFSLGSGSASPSRGCSDPTCIHARSDVWGVEGPGNAP